MPEARNEHRSLNQYECEFLIDESLPCFAGHFPGEAIVPGVVQIDWAIRAGALLGLPPQSFRGVPRAKFSAVIVPDTRLKLSLSRHGQSLDFCFASADQVHSAGRIDYAD